MFLWCWLRTFSSLVISNKLATPDNRTGRASMLLTLRDAAGLGEWCRAKPAGRTEKRAFLWEETRSRIWGRFPELDLTIPTCSAVSVHLISFSAIATDIEEV